MSGPKTSSYEVVRDLEAERRALSGAWASLREMERRWHACIADVRAAEALHGALLPAVHVPTIAVPDSAAGIDRVRQAHAALAESVARLPSLLQVAVAQATLRASLRSAQHDVAGGAFASSDDGWARLEAADDAARATRARSDAEANRAERARRIDRALGSLLHGEEADEIVALGSQAASASSDGRFDVLLIALKSRIACANERAAARERQRQRAEALRVRLEEIDGALLVAERARVRDVLAGRSELDDATHARIGEAIDGARAEASRATAARELRDALIAAGYVVGDDFETRFTEGGSTRVAKAGWSQHAVQFESDANRARLRYSVVRHDLPPGAAASETKARDQEIETEWCDDHARLQAGMRARGVELGVLARSRPGDVPVQVVTPRERLSSGERRVAARQREMKP